VLSGYIERLQRPENLIYFFRNVCACSVHSPVSSLSHAAPPRGVASTRSTLATTRSTPLWTTSQQLLASNTLRKQTPRSTPCKCLAS
jgi:hypothetical protein